MIPDITYYTMSISDNPTALLPSRDALKIRVLKRVFKLDGHGVTQCLLVTLHQYLNIRMGMGCGYGSRTITNQMDLPGISKRIKLQLYYQMQ